MLRIFEKLFVVTMFIIVPSLMLHADLNLKIEQGRKSVNWPKTQGEILKSKVKKSKTSKGHIVYDPYVWYKYAVNGKVYGSRVMQFSNSARTLEFASNYVVSHPVGHKITVYYNPEKPKQATLKTGVDTFTQVIYYALNIVRFVAVGFLLLFIARFTLGRKSFFEKKFTIKKNTEKKYRKKISNIDI